MLQPHLREANELTIHEIMWYFSDNFLTMSYIWAQVSNYFCNFVLIVNTHPCPNFNGKMVVEVKI